MTKNVGAGPDTRVCRVCEDGVRCVGMKKRECACDNVLDVPAGQWIPACAGMTRV